MPKPLLQRLWLELDRSGVSYCLLRGTERLDPPVGDVDLLVSSSDVEAFHDVAGSVGFMLKRRWSDDTQHHLVGMDGPQRVVLHGVTEIGFGHPDFPWLLDIADGVLERAHGAGTGGPVVADPRDEFWISLHHCLLDKRTVRAHHQTRLQALYVEVSPDDEAAAHLDPPLRSLLLAQVRDGDWEGLLRVAGIVHEQVRRSQAWIGQIRHVRRSAELRVRRMVERISRRGISVALMAPDGAGKSTLTQALGKRLPIPSRSLYLGQYPEGAQRPSELPGWSLVVRILRLWGTWYSVRRTQAQGHIVIFDRHTLGARLPSRSSSLRRRVRRWLLGRALPQPDLVLFLDAPADLLHRRRPEHDVKELEEQRRAHLLLASKTSNAVVLDATQPADLVAEHAAAAIWQAHLVRHRAKGHR